MIRTKHAPAAELASAGILLLAFGVFLFWPEVVVPPFPCLFHAITGYPCVACGGTRALHLVTGGDFGAALAMNPLVAFGALGSGLFVLYAFALLVFRFPPIRPEFRSGTRVFILRAGVLGAIAANWIYLVFDGR